MVKSLQVTVFKLSKLLVVSKKACAEHSAIPAKDKATDLMQPDCRQRSNRNSN